LRNAIEELAYEILIESRKIIDKIRYAYRDKFGCYPDEISSKEFDIIIDDNNKDEWGDRLHLSKWLELDFIEKITDKYVVIFAKEPDQDFYSSGEISIPIKYLTEGIDDSFISEVLNRLESIYHEKHIKSKEEEIAKLEKQLQKLKEQ